MCREDGVEPRRQFSGKFHLRVPAGVARGHCGSSGRRRKEPQSVGHGRIDCQHHRRSVKRVLYEAERACDAYLANNGATKNMW